MTIGGKVVAGVATLGTIGGGGLLASSLLNKTITYEEGTVGTKLISEGFKLEIGNGWKTILDAHNNIKDTQNTFKTNANTDLKLDELQSKCQSALKEKDDTNYKKARKWCVKTEKIKDILNNGKYDLLDTADTNNTRDTEWGTLATKLNGSKSSFPTIGSQMSGESTADIKALKKGCSALQVDTVTTITTGFDEKFDNAKTWCSVEKTPNKK